MIGPSLRTSVDDEMTSSRTSDRAPRSHTSQVLHLRASVAILGEHASPAWWPSQFFSEDFDYHISFVAPRAPYLAKLRGATAAARLRHDENTGTKAYHLFRLPTAIEAQLTDVLHQADPESLRLPTDVDSARSAIDDFGRLTGSGKSGAVEMGPIDALNATAALEDLIRIYATAFQEGPPVFPFYTAES